MALHSIDLFIVRVMRYRKGAMPQINFKKNRPAISVESGSNLLKALQEAKIPVASSCGGVGVCIKCKLEIVKGIENLSVETADERDLREIHDIPKGTRLACLNQVLGDITIDSTYW